MYVNLGADATLPSRCKAMVSHKHLSYMSETQQRACFPTLLLLLQATYVGKGLVR